MNELSGAVKSSVGMKFIMAISGIALVVFVIGHMAGNVQMFIGQDAMNSYAVTLRKMPALLWAVRLGLFLFFAIHVYLGIKLKLENLAARPVRYSRKDTVQASLASRTMMISGSIVLGFLVYHLLHFTLGKTNPDHFHYVDAQGRHDVYSMVVLGFQNVFISGFYIAIMLLLSFHLRHGASSFFQSLGINNPAFNGFIKRFGPVVAFIVVAGFIAVPVGVLLGIIKLPEGGM
jgi:succinate dehydrogenase / fumarate reductase cytochrome b subunit